LTSAERFLSLLKLKNYDLREEKLDQVVVQRFFQVFEAENYDLQRE